MYPDNDDSSCIHSPDRKKNRISSPARKSLTDDDEDSKNSKESSEDESSEEEHEQHDDNSEGTDDGEDSENYEGSSDEESSEEDHEHEKDSESVGYDSDERISEATVEALYHVPYLVSDDIDIYKAEDELEGDLVMLKSKGSVSYPTVEGFKEGEINIVKCKSVSGQGFLANNDINATAICVEVLGDEPELIMIHTAPAFWEFFCNTEKRGS